MAIEHCVRELTELIATVVAPEPDCRGIRLYQDPTDPTLILLSEQWTGRDAKHLTSTSPIPR
ncbi:MAG: antibiotic biosynthesis monooxygenase [Gemmatimonadales bacterium]|nr:antibiotic biosynthesis monooxygenase [Gemmatimonadales bacterium]